MERLPRMNADFKFIIGVTDEMYKIKCLYKSVDGTIQETYRWMTNGHKNSFKTLWKRYCQNYKVLAESDITDLIR